MPPFHCRAQVCALPKWFWLCWICSWESPDSITRRRVKILRGRRAAMTDDVHTHTQPENKSQQEHNQNSVTCGSPTLSQTVAPLTAFRNVGTSSAIFQKRKNNDASSYERGHSLREFCKLDHEFELNLFSIASGCIQLYSVGFPINEYQLLKFSEIESLRFL
jgi:hypothetical protein